MAEGAQVAAQRRGHTGGLLEGAVLQELGELAGAGGGGVRQQAEQPLAVARQAQLWRGRGRAGTAGATRAPGGTAAVVGAGVQAGEHGRQAGGKGVQPGEGARDQPGREKAAAGREGGAESVHKAGELG